MKTLKEAMIKTEQEQAVEDYLEAINVKMNVQLLRVGRKRDDWECDMWIVQFTSERGEEEFEYYTGTGHRAVDERNYEYQQLKDEKNLKYKNQQLRKIAKPVKPLAASVLYSLISDSEACGMSFEEWCSNLGYDEDSRKAEATYDACREGGKKLFRIFTGEQIECLKELLQDY